MKSEPFFSIVIPTLNEEKYLPFLLSDLVEQTDQDFEVLHIDGDSTDLTRPKAQEFSSHLSLTTYIASKRNVSFQRNLGADHARGKYIIFMDADIRFSALFIEGIRNYLLENPETDVFTCLIDTKAYSLIDRPIIEITNLGLEIHARFQPAAIGALIGVKTELCRDHRFDQNLPISEDQMFVMQLVKNGHTFALIRETRFILSLRRFKSGNTLVLIRTYLQADLFFLTKQQFIKNLPDYPMEGGRYYDTKSDPLLLEKTLSYIKENPAKYLNKIKEILKKISR